MLSTLSKVLRGDDPEAARTTEHGRHLREDVVGVADTLLGTLEHDHVRITLSPFDFPGLFVAISGGKEDQGMVLTHAVRQPCMKKIL